MLAFLVCVLVALVYGGWRISLWAEDEQRAPVQRIVISGDRQHIEDADVENMIRRSQPGSFFELDVDKVHKDLESLAWIYRASVRKRWPNSLHVYVVEQQAEARWNGDQLLNRFGESFQAQLDDEALPDLFGPGGSEQTALQGYKTMQSLLNSAGLDIREMFLSERFAWNVRLTNGVVLNLGRSQFVDRLQRFVDVYPLLIKQPKPIDYVDLRYDTGFAVGWKQQEKNENKSES